jgi:hypothetical protein
MNYKDKYKKYKTKYLELKDNQKDMTNNFNKIVKFLKKSKKEDIKNELYNIIKNNDYCPNILGEGHFGIAYVPEVNKTMSFIHGKIKLNLPIVIKERKSNENPDMYADIDIIDKKLYISGYDNITTEALILMFVRQIYHKTVHLPLILAYGVCSKLKIIDRIITYKHGLDEIYEKDLTGKIYNEAQLWHKPKYEITYKFKNSLSTLKELFGYIHYNKNKDGTIDLLNGIKNCNVSELFDYISISYLATHHLLTENNIIPSDMHAGNIFIHWLNDNSYYNNKSIKNISEIIYKVNKKFYKIKTFGFVIILGDLGTSIVKIKEDVYIIGQIWDIKNNYKLIKQRLKPEHTNIDFIEWNKDLLNLNEYKKKIAYKIFSEEPYSLNPMTGWHLIGKDIKYLNNLKKTTELLEYYYEKYGIKKYTENKNNILIEI